MTVGWGDRNLAKARHADEIRETLDVQILFVNTARIRDESSAINNIRIAIQLLGLERVVVVATKIDVSTSHTIEVCC